MFLTPGPCESLGRLRKLTKGLEQDCSLPSPCSSSIFASVVLTRVASPREETEAGYGVGKVLETSTKGKTEKF
jgi:hypothetical protein